MCPAVLDITQTAYNRTFQPPWVGSLEADRAWMWIDNFLLLVRLKSSEENLEIELTSPC